VLRLGDLPGPLHHLPLSFDRVGLDGDELVVLLEHHGGEVLHQLGQLGDALLQAAQLLLPRVRFLQRGPGRARTRRHDLHIQRWLSQSRVTIIELSRGGLSHSLSKDLLAATGKGLFNLLLGRILLH
jgi:hypothetical protein